MSDVVKLNIKSGKLNVKVKNEISADGISFETSDDYYQKQLEQQYRTGFDEGVKAARTQLENNYQELIAEKFAAFENFACSVDNALSNYEYEFETIVFNLAAIIAEKIIGREVEKENIILRVISESLKKVLGANKIVIKLNPKDIEWINEFNGTFLREEKFAKIRFEADEVIECGGCIVESEIGNVDATITSQINEIKRQLELARTTEAAE